MTYIQSNLQTTLTSAFSTTNGSKVVTLTFSSAHNINKFDIILLDNFTSITNSGFVSGDFTDKKIYGNINTNRHNSYNTNGI
jgi:hypothetical protein